MARDVESRFWAKVKKAGPNDCWVWLAGRSAGFGHGMFCLNGRMEFAHRVVLLLSNGQMPTTGVRHTCDNPPCVNPAHLVLGTQAQNVQDMVDRHRQARGEVNGQAKLDSTMVVEIKKRRSAGEQGATLAREFSVSKQTVCDIFHGRTWTHVGSAPLTTPGRGH